jgi:glycosyltransferase involved in cell wall biosynthesis
MWHVLDCSAAWMKEFVSALSGQVETLGWAPERRWFGWFERWHRVEDVSDPPMRLCRYPLQRGYHLRAFGGYAPIRRALLPRLLAFSPDPAGATLVCTSPYHYPVAEAWKGPKIYYTTDMLCEYPGIDRSEIVRAERTIAGLADVVCANSQRNADYLVGEAGCPPGKVVVTPNATRESNILPEPAWLPGDLPSDAAGLPRPVAGIIGNMAGNVDWLLLQDAIAATPWLHWLFVGPARGSIPVPAAERARKRVLCEMPNVLALGPRPYGTRVSYARALDVAVLPYQAGEPTFSGSSARFYDHLAACRPILATRAVEELLHKEPLLRLVDSADDLVAALDSLRSRDFDDGLQELRWKASRSETWEARARQMRIRLADEPGRSEERARLSGQTSC